MQYTPRGLLMIFCLFVFCLFEGGGVTFVKHYKQNLSDLEDFALTLYLFSHLCGIFIIHMYSIHASEHKDSPQGVKCPVSHQDCQLNKKIFIKNCGKVTF